MTSWTTSTITNKEDIFQCNICPEDNFETKLEATNHFIEKHLDHLQEFEVCQYCIEVFPNRNILKKHFDEVHPNVQETIYKCKYCTGTEIKLYETRSITLMKDHYRQGYYQFRFFQ